MFASDPEKTDFENLSDSSYSYISLKSASWQFWFSLWSQFVFLFFFKYVYICCFALMSVHLITQSSLPDSMDNFHYEQKLSKDTCVQEVSDVVFVQLKSMLIFLRIRSSQHQMSKELSDVDVSGVVTHNVFLVSFIQSGEVVTERIFS